MTTCLVVSDSKKIALLSELKQRIYHVYIQEKVIFDSFIVLLAFLNNSEIEHFAFGINRMDCLQFEYTLSCVQSKQNANKRLFSAKKYVERVLRNVQKRFDSHMTYKTKCKQKHKENENEKKNLLLKQHLKAIEIYENFKKILDWRNHKW